MTGARLKSAVIRTCAAVGLDGVSILLFLKDLLRIPEWQRFTLRDVFRPQLAAVNL